MSKSKDGGEGEFTEEEAKAAGYSSAEEMNDDRAAQEAALGRPPEDDQA
jgi:hypothetical protein